MKVADFYRWEAEMPDGVVVTKGGDIAGAIRVSLIPADGVPLPRHDLIGLEFERRFLKQFKRFSLAQGFDRMAHALEIERKRGFTEEGREERMARRKAFWKSKGWDVDALPKKTKPDNAAQCVETDDSRIWVVHLNGSVLVTPKDYELRL